MVAQGCVHWDLAFKNALSAGSDRADEREMLKVVSREAGRCKKGHFGDGERNKWLTVGACHLK